MINTFEHALKKEDRVLDIGPGTCNVCEILLQKGYMVTPLDVRNVSFVPSIQPLLYNGNTMPFKDKSFDVALILTVLHHTLHPEKILKEAMRVSKKVIIIEETYSNIFHKYLTYFFDSLLNLEFFGHPHTNKNKKEWGEIFSKLGFSIVDERYYNDSSLIFKQALYILEKQEI